MHAEDHDQRRTRAAALAGRACAAVAVLTGGAAAAVTVAWATADRWALVVVLVAAILWGLGGAVAVALAPTRRPAPTPLDDDQPPVLGTLVHLGDVPDVVARTMTSAAATTGPVALVVPPGRDAPPGLDPRVLVHRGVEAGSAVDRAAADLAGRCDAVLVCSARAVPDPDGCRAAAAELAGGASWVVGTAETLNPDRFGPARRDRLDARLRHLAGAAGVALWEPDATVVTSSLLRDHPLPDGRPLGSWLRARVPEGHRGATIGRCLAVRAAPVSATGYWPDTTARQCAAAADLADATLGRRVPLRSRMIVAGLAVRALFGWSVLWWLAVLAMLAGGSPLQGGDRVVAGLVLASTLLRWCALRWSTRTRPAPVADAVGALYAVPGSLTATASAVTRRPRSGHRRVPTRPLVWLGLVATAAAGTAALGSTPGDQTGRVASAAAAVLLVLLWVLTVRSLVERTWSRVGFRIPLDLPATLDGADDSADDGADSDADDGAAAAGRRLLDGSPGGFALAGPRSGLAPGDELTVRVDAPPGPPIVLDGTVADRRGTSHSTELLGVELRAVRPDAGRWDSLLVSAAVEHREVAPRTAVGQRPEPHAGPQRWADRLTIGLVVVVSVAVAGLLMLVLAGFRPLVVRSGSMEPTYSIGDVVLVSERTAGDLRPGQVVTRFGAPQAMDSLTHRVRSVERRGDDVAVETRGDANDGSEFWTVPASTPVGVVTASIPAIGRPLTLVRTSLGWAVAVGTLVVGLVLFVLRPRRHRPDATPRPLKVDDEVPTTTGANARRAPQRDPIDTTRDRP